MNSGSGTIRVYIKIQTSEVRQTNKVGCGIIGVVNGALEKVLVEAGNIMVSLNLPRHILAIESKGADVLVHLLHWLKRLHHLCPFVQHLLLHRHRLPRRYLLPAGRKYPTDCFFHIIYYLSVSIV